MILRQKAAKVYGILGCWILNLWVPALTAANAQSVPDEKFRPFVQKDYDPKTISQKEFHHGSARIQITQAGRRFSNSDEAPIICRAWIEVIQGNQTTFRKYFDDIDPAGSSYGVFIPKAQPPAPYFAVVKIGDYDGRLYLIHENGKVDDLRGGGYFITKDKRYLFSQYISDGTGLEVIDLQAGRKVYSSNSVPYIYQWYVKDGAYFFTESEWMRSNRGAPTEKAGIAHFYDFEAHQIISRKITEAETAAARRLENDFDPGSYDNCATEQHTTPDGTPNQAPVL